MSLILPSSHPARPGRRVVPTSSGDGATNFPSARVGRCARLIGATGGWSLREGDGEREGWVGRTLFRRLFGIEVLRGSPASEGLENEFGNVE